MVPTAATIIAVRIEAGCFLEMDVVDADHNERIEIAYVTLMEG